jgi:hypothetical protein
MWGRGPALCKHNYLKKFFCTKCNFSDGKFIIWGGGGRAGGGEVIRFLLGYPIFIGQYILSSSLIGNRITSYNSLTNEMYGYCTVYTMEKG